MHSKPLVVVVEDDEYLADIYSDILKGIDAEVIVFNDGETALMYLASASPALIVLDLNLPKYPGSKILTFVRDNPKLRDTWVIITSADTGQVADLNRSAHLSHNLLTLIKPVSVDQLEQLARRLISKATD